MTVEWTRLIVDNTKKFGAVVRVSVIKAEGSTPRNTGTWMLIMPRTIEQTIGGGRLEFEAIRIARRLLASQNQLTTAWHREVRSFPLGPGLGQCCGGNVSLLFEVLARSEVGALQRFEHTNAATALLIRPTTAGQPMLLAANRKHGFDLPLHITRIVNDMLSGARPSRATHIHARKGHDGWFIEPIGGRKHPLFIYGAGHVGRAIIGLTEELNFDTVWVDTDRARFPRDIPAFVTPAITRAPEQLARDASSEAFHLVLTFSHTLDLAICHALLARADFAFLGLIGSKTKRARFLKRLREAGINEAALARLTCPIGISSIRGKEPATIAISVAAQLIERSEKERHQARHTVFRREHV